MGNLEFIKSGNTTSGTNLSITNCFNSTYDVYKVFLSDIDFDGTGDKGIGMRFLDSAGSVIVASEYSSAMAWLYSNTTPGESRYVNITGFSYGFGYTGSNNQGNIGSNLTIYNPYDASSYTLYTSHSSGVGANLLGNKQIGSHNSAEQITGINIYVNGAGDFARLTVKVYGVR